MKESVCVVGGGLAGGVVAATLAARGCQVTLLELGETPAPLQAPDETWEASRIRVPFTRGQGIGGSSNFWHGGLTTLDRTDVEGVDGHRRDACPPLSYDELRAYYEKAVALLRGDCDFTLSDIQATPTGPAGSFPLAGDVFRYKALFYPASPFSTRPLIERAAQASGLRVIANARVRRFGGASAQRVTWAEYVDGKTGQPRKIEADRFVLSAGGLGSPKILLQSADQLTPIGKLRVGRSIIDHPTGFVFKAKLRRRLDLSALFGVAAKGGRLRNGFVLSPGSLGAADGRNHILYLRPAVSLKDPRAYETLKNRLVGHRASALRAGDFFELARHTDLLFDAVNFRFGLMTSTRYVTGFVFAEQWPRESERIEARGGGRYAVRWQFSREDEASLVKFLRLFGQTYADLFERFDLYPDTSARLDSAGHHSGACRMARSARDGVVDEDLRVFGMENLHVVDGSVLGSSGHANTGLTIAAMALKCCDAIEAP